MENVLTVLKSMLILTGFITLLYGKFLYPKFILSRKVKYKIPDSHVKVGRLMLYIVGPYYMILGFILLTIKGWPMLFIYLTSILPALVGFLVIHHMLKHT